MADVLVTGQPYHLVGEQLDGPARPSLGRVRAGGGDQQQFLVVRQLPFGSFAGGFLQGLLQALLDEVPLGAEDRGRPHAQTAGDILLRVSAVGGEQDQGALDLADAGTASVNQLAQDPSFFVAKLDLIVHVHRRLLDGQWVH